MQINKTLSWDDYRTVLVISRAGGVTRAAESLGVTVSTVFRRLERIEERIQTQLFDRDRKGYRPTDAGREAIRAAEIMEQAAFAADRMVSGRDQQLSGTLRVTATESLAGCFLARHMEAFRDAHQGITVNIISENRVLSLAEREADIALRPRRPDDETLIGRKIAKLNWGIYSNPDAAKKIGAKSSPALLSDQRFIVWEAGRLALESQEWLRQTVPDAEIAYRTSSLITNAQMAATGAGLAPLPCFVGAVWPRLQPVLAPLTDAGTAGELWLVIHEDMRHNARVRALVDHLVSAAHQDAGLFTGDVQSAE